MKTCPKCKVKRTLDNFTKNKSTKDGLSSWCRQCNRNAQLQWQMNGGSKKKKVYADAAHLKDPSKRKAKALRQNYGISLEEYNAMWEKQDEACAICKLKETAGKGFHMDHDHQTGKIRGILCHSCNLMLGNAKDNISTMKSAISYLGKHL